jgi:cytochrome c-type biogenesis protein|tara:strand:- start:1709 stop:3157 length:1449 start_codon:yes stop_codon:yes gene_type:complete
VVNTLDFSILKEKDTWKSFGIAIVLFSIIGYSSLSLFGISTSMYGISDDVKVTPDFIVPTMNRTGIDSLIDDDGDGMVKLSELRGSVVILDFMAIDCSNCHLVQAHIDKNFDDWNNLQGEYPIVVLSIASWYAIETYDNINSTFGDENSNKYMRWPVANGGNDVIILEEGGGDILEYYNVRLPPYILVIDHEGFAVSRENTGFPLDQWESFDSAVEMANIGEAEGLRFGLTKTDNSILGVFFIGLFVGVLVYFSPCAFPVLPSFITYYLNLGMREDELRENGKISGRIPNSFEVGGFAALGQLTFFSIIGLIIFGLNGVVNLSGALHDIAIMVALILVILGVLMLLGWTSNILAKTQKILDKYQNTEQDDIFTPRKNMYIWGIGYSAASVDCTAAAVFPFMAWLITISNVAFISGIAGLIISVTALMIIVTVLVSSGRKNMIQTLRKSSLIIKSTGSWMMIFAGIGLLIYLTQAELIVSLIG